MLAATENSIRSLIYEDRNDIFSSLASTKLVLEQLHESGEGQFSKVEIFDDLMKLIEISEHINATKNLPEKIKLISEEYQTLARQIRIKYSDFLPNRVNRELEAGEKYVEGLKKLMIAQQYILLGFDDKNLVDQVGKIYTGMVQLSEVLEHYILYFPKRSVGIIKKIAIAILEDPTIQPEQSNISQEAVNYLIALKNTARGVLWQLDNYRVEKKHTVGELLNWLDTAHGWAGDDFEECLEYINRTRK